MNPDISTVVASEGQQQSPSPKSHTFTALDLINRWVRETPAEIAVESGPASATFAALWESAGRISDALSRAANGTGPLVGLALSRGPQLLPALIGIWRSEAGYVPLDTRMPAARRDRIMTQLRDHGMRWVLADEQAAEALQLPVAGRVDAVDGAGPVLLCSTGTKIAVTQNTVPARTAYVMYTSGSTGEPKGTVVSHANVAAFLRAMDAVLAPDSREEITFATTPLTFDISVLEIVWPLSAGRRVVLLDSIDRVSPQIIEACLSRPEPKLLQLTPSTSELMQFPDSTGNLRVLIGGEALHRGTAERLRPCCTRLYNMYGPTEATVWVSFHEVVDPANEAPVVSIGRPLPGCELEVTTAEGVPVAAGEEGELRVTGPQVALGYLASGEPAAINFIADTGHGYRSYRTGDRVRQGPDGTLSFIGRIDNQIKIAGNRVELGEVEAVLRQHQGVARAVVAADAGRTTPVLHAFIERTASETSGTSRDPFGRSLDEYLRAHLPAHMLPGRIHVLDRIPVNTSGKIDRPAVARMIQTAGGDAQPEPAASSALRVEDRSSAQRAASPTTVASGLTEILTAILGRRVDTTNDFFEAGLESVGMLRLLAAIRSRYGASLNSLDLLDAPTAEQLAVRVADAVPG